MSEQIPWKTLVALVVLLGLFGKCSDSNAGSPTHPGYDHYEHKPKVAGTQNTRTYIDNDNSSRGGTSTAAGGAAKAEGGSANVGEVSGGAGGSGGEGGSINGTTGGAATNQSDYQSRDRAYALAISFAPVWSPGSPNHCSVHNAQSLGLLFGAFSHSKSGTLIDEVCQQLRLAELQDNMCRAKTAAAIRLVVFEKWGSAYLRDQGRDDWRDAHNYSFEECTNMRTRSERAAMGLAPAAALPTGRGNAAPGAEVIPLPAASGVAPVKKVAKRKKPICPKKPRPSGLKWHCYAE